MFFELIRKKKKSGLTAASLYLTEYKDGKRERTYIPVDQAIAAVPDYVLQRKKTLLKKLCRKVFEKGRRGRPPKITHHDKGLLEAAGFNVHKNEIRRDRRRFFTPEAAAMRFALLDEGIRNAVGSAEKLMEYEQKALSMMKSNASEGIGIGFRESFEKLISQALGKFAVPGSTNLSLIPLFF